MAAGNELGSRLRRRGRLDLGKQGPKWAEKKGFIDLHNNEAAGRVYYILLLGLPHQPYIYIILYRDVLNWDPQSSPWFSILSHGHP